MKPKHLLFVLSCLLAVPTYSQKDHMIEAVSPGGKLILTVTWGDKLEWSIVHRGQRIIAPSSISMELGDGRVLGDDAEVMSSPLKVIDTEFEAINYRRATVRDHCVQLTLNCRGDYGVTFRIYDDAVAYRFFTGMEGEVVIKNEEVTFNFTDDHQAFIPYMWDYRDGKIFNCSFESLYTEQRISEFRKDSLAFLPLLVDVGQGKKAVILEADLEDYPGMFLDVNRETAKGFMGVFAPYPLKCEQAGINYIPVERAGYIARVKGTRTFPWRVVAISQEDKELLNNDIVQKLASPCRLEDVSWIRPGQVAWDWWNATNISQVDFRAGMNAETYKYYIDFAAANGIPYIIIDAGWSSPGDLTKTRPGFDLPAIIEQGKEKGVGVIIWVGWHQLMQQLDEVFAHYSAMAIKGFKIDFIDRDDQLAVASTYEMAEKAAEYKLMVDFHGVFKPTGLQRTWPNVVGYEGVKGMENVKWAVEDVPRYDVTLPYIRMMAGPMDYTPGAMRNANRQNFRPINNNPMSQGTRCHQLAMYVIFEVPLQMLSDNPTIYMKEQECTDFITSIPVSLDETVPLEGEVARYAAVARRKGDTWYVGAMTNWESRDLELDFSFLGEGKYKATAFSDGINADRQASDYKREVITVTSADKLSVHLAPGGGWAARLEKTD